jgi:hypothetical protein
MTLSSTTTPAILRIGSSEWKVSPYGPTQPDLDASYTGTRAYAEDAARRSVIEAHTGLARLQFGLDDLRQYLLSSKFSADATVQVRDVLTRLEQLRHRADAQGRADAEAMISGRYPQAG